MLPERFTSKFKIEESGCWIWQAAKRSGYGAFYHEGVMLGAHQVSYRLLVGPIAPRLELDHLCRNRACVNPAHLEPVTRKENALRSPLVGREWGKAGRAAHLASLASRTHCPNGHEYTVENSYRPPGTQWRKCKDCNRAACARYTLSGRRPARRHAERLVHVGRPL